MSGDTEQESFSDVLSEDITPISRRFGAWVAARTPLM